MALEPRELNDTDELLLPYLRQGRVTPVLAKQLIEQDGKDVSRPYVQQRLKRLEEHGHLDNLLDTGVYELVDDPEQNIQDASSAPSRV